MSSSETYCIDDERWTISSEEQKIGSEKAECYILGNEVAFLALENMKALIYIYGGT